MSDHLADEIERMNTRWMPLVAERLWLCSRADSQVALRRESDTETDRQTNKHCQKYNLLCQGGNTLSKNDLQF